MSLHSAHCHVMLLSISMFPSTSLRDQHRYSVDAAICGFKYNCFVLFFFTLQIHSFYEILQKIAVSDCKEHLEVSFSFCFLFFFFNKVVKLRVYWQRHEMLLNNAPSRHCARKHSFFPHSLPRFTNNCELVYTNHWIGTHLNMLDRSRANNERLVNKNSCIHILKI